MGSPIEDMANHLQFLAYEVSRDDKLTKAIHRTKPNILLRKYNGGVLFTSIYRCNDQAKSNRLAYLDFVNGMNVRAAVTRFYADKDLDFFMEAYYPGAYERAAFGVFLELWDRDTQEGLAHSDASKYLR